MPTTSMGETFDDFQSLYLQRTLNRFKAKVGTGVRTNQFEVKMKLPNKIQQLLNEKGFNRQGQDYVRDFTDTFAYLCTTAQIPASTQGEITVNFRGRAIKIAGDKTFENWSTTVINDFDFSIRRVFELWHSAINQNDLNIGIDRVEDYQCDEVHVVQLGRNGAPLRYYVLYNVWPVNVDAIDLASDSMDEIEKFGLTLSVQHWMAYTPDKTESRRELSDNFFELRQLSSSTNISRNR